MVSACGGGGGENSQEVFIDYTISIYQEHASYSMLTITWNKL